MIDDAELARLRGLCHDLVASNWDEPVVPRATLVEALDEIERLREILGNVEFYLRGSGLEDECAPRLLEQIKPFRTP